MEPTVIAYYLTWNPEQDIGAVTLKFSDGNETTYKVTSLSDLAGWAQLVRQQLFIAQDGTLHTYPLG